MRIAICDDEREVREILEEKTGRLCPEAEILLFSSGEELLAADAPDVMPGRAQDKVPDILFLDIQMPGVDGMETAKALRKRNKKMILIFITALEEYVFRAFDVGAFHYLVKPFSEEKFASVLKNAVEEYRQRTEISDYPKPKEDAHIMILSGGSHIKVKMRDIVYAEVYNRKVILHKMAEDIEYYGKLSDLEKLAGEDFFRCHRSYLVNFRFVVKYDASEVTMEKGTAPMAKQKFSVFVKSYLKYNQRTGSGRKI